MTTAEVTKNAAVAAAEAETRIAAGVAAAAQMTDAAGVAIKTEVIAHPSMTMVWRKEVGQEAQNQCNKGKFGGSQKLENC